MDIQEEKRRWRAQTHDPVLKRFPERKPGFETSSGIPMPTILTPGAGNQDFLDKLGFPGEYPFTRGVQPSMYRGRLWTMRQYAGYASAEESNKRYHFLLAQGQKGLSVAFDLPTQIGYDADHPLAHGEVGKVGVSISSLEDMEMLFRGIPLDRVSTSMTINAPAAVLLALYIAVAKQQSVEVSSLRGTVQNDILKEYIAGYIYLPPKTVHAADHRLVSILPAGGPPVEYDKYFRVPYPRGGVYRGPGSGFYPGKWDCLCPGGRRRRFKCG